MSWLNPLAWFGLVAVAVPILVHLLAHRRAERIPFPTLRFIQPTRLAAIQRRALEDLALLAVRSAIVVLAVAAFAGPLLVTGARRAAWNARLVRAVVAQGPGVAPSSVVAQGPDPFRFQQFDAITVPDGIHRAVAWLESAPPARRELVIAAPLTIGSLSDADLASIPGDIGLRFVRTVKLPPSRSVSAPVLMTRTNVLRRTITLDGRTTSVREAPDPASADWPIEIVAPPTLQQTADAAVAAVLSLRIRLQQANHRARLVLLDAGQENSTWGPALAGPTGGGPAAAGPAAIRTSWMADAVARIARDATLQEEATRAARGLTDARAGQPPWHVLARAADGRPLASAAASSDTLVVASIARAGDLVVPTLVRAIADGLAPADDLGANEVVPIADSRLRAWTREPGAPPPPRPEAVERDDRRWMWAGVLLLLGVETWMRRSRREADDIIEEAPARVA